MAKRPSRSGQKWTPREIQQLRSLAKHNTPTRIIGLKLHRSAAAVYKQASRKGISLKPTNQSPYGNHS